MLQIGTRGADWPLTGRTEELEVLHRLRSGSPPRGAVITGPPGVGKSRLAASAGTQAAAEGWTVLAIRASAGLSGMPLGPLRTVLRVPSSSDLTEMTASVEAELTRMLSGKGLLVLADDCHELDDASASLLHQLASAGLLVVLITARSGARVPTAVTDLWKDGLAERVQLENLSLREAAALVAAGLGGAVEDSSAERLWHVTAGNPLYLREVVLSSVETGALRETDGRWRWRGSWASGSRVQEIVASRLGRLGPEESTAIEMVALAGSLPLALLSGLTSARAVEELEARALVKLERSGRRLEVGIAHPLHAEVLRAAMPALRRRAMWHNLVDALTRLGVHRNSDRVRLACWSIEAGLSADPMTLALGSDASLFGIGHAVAARLNEILPDAVARLGDEVPAVREDLDLAIRLARAAYERSGSFADGVALASALAWTGATSDAEAVLAELLGREEAVDDRIRLGLQLAWIRFWCRFDAEAAFRTVHEMIEAATDGCDRGLLAESYQALAGMELNVGNPAGALAHAEQAAAVEGVELSGSIAAPPASAALNYLGRCNEAMSLIDRAIPVARERGHPLALATLLFTRGAVLARSGRLEEAREQLEWLREVAVSGDLLDAAGAVGVLLGEVLLRQGRPATADRILRDSCGILAERDVLGYRPWALSALARARARVGEVEAAAADLEEARRTQPIARHYELSRYLADIEVCRLQGRSDAAADAARQAVDWARAAGMVVDEAYAWDAWFRLGPSEAAATRLAELAGMTDSELVQALAEHARAALGRDASGLLAVAESFAGMGAWWMAAEAAGAAAVLLERRGRVRDAKRALRRAGELAERCEGLDAAAASNLSGPARLTRREREIATLAAGGRSTRQIAEKMYLSPRTVENHLHHAYMKLGVSDRAQLARALSSTTTE